MRTLKISVIIPTFKPQGYIWDCLDSLRNQSFPIEDFEVIIVLNGPELPWRTEIESYINNNHITNFSLLYTSSPGVSNARNLALERIQGEYVAFIDDDDYVSPCYLEELFFRASLKVIPLCYPLSFVDGTDEYKPFYVTKDYDNNINIALCDYKKARRFFSGPVYKLIHKDIIKHRRFNCSFKNGEDSIFMFELSDAFNLVTFTSRKAVYYRRIRKGSALLRRKRPMEVLSNCYRMIIAYTKIFLSRPFKYNFLFYSTRVLGAIHGAIEQFNIRRGII